MESVQEKTIVALYDDFAEAQRVVQDLVDRGFQRNSISIIASDADGEHANYLAEEDDDVSGAEGAGFGAVVGGLTGLLVGLGALAIPGIGPVLVAGPIASTLIGAGVGAITGGVVGALVDLGVPEEEAGYYAEGVRRGGTLVTIHTPTHMSERAVDIMERHNPVDVEEQVSTWQEKGWTSFDAEAGPYAPMVEEEQDWAAADGSTSPAYVSPSLEREGAFYDEDEFNTFDEDFRRHYSGAYTSSGTPYEQYLPAYRYGYNLALDERYDDWDWNRVEPEARSYWEANKEGPWENFKDAVQYSWEQVKELMGVDDAPYDDNDRQAL